MFTYLLDNEDHGNLLSCDLLEGRIELKQRIRIRVFTNQSEILKKNGEWLKSWYIFEVSDEKKYWRSFFIKNLGFSVESTYTDFDALVYSLCNEVNTAKHPRIFGTPKDCSVYSLMPAWTGITNALEMKKGG